MTRFLCAGTGEQVKALYHGALAAGFAGACIYNLCAFLSREEMEPHLLVNAIVDAAIVALEVAHMQHHRRATDQIRIRPIDGGRHVPRVTLSDAELADLGE